MVVDPEADLVNHVPDEVCVLVQSSEERDPNALYDEVRDALNSALRRVLAQAPPTAWTPDAALLRDLMPTELHERFGGSSAVLQPLERPGISRAGTAASGVRPPWHSLTSDTQSTHHFYYAVGTDRVDFHLEHRDERLRRLAAVRKLVNLLNHSGTGLSATSTGRWSVVGASPNWLTVAAQIICGSPAGPPRAETEGGRWRFRFEPDLKAELNQSPRGEPAKIVVAILDTAPPSSVVPTHGNTYITELLKVVRIHTTHESSAALHPDHFDSPPDVQHYWNTVRPWWTDPLDSEDVDVQDHGLFVAGIIHDIAPNAEIHLIRVLNDTGVGDWLGLGHVLSSLPTALNIGGNRRLIVNLSLGSAVPVPPRRHWQRWLPETHAAHARPDASMKGLLDAAHMSLWSTVDWLHRQGVLVVAAAGNDALRRPTTHDGMPPPPRYPARYQEVFAVAAARADGTAASYSNRADVVALTNGITSFGGELGQAGKGVVGVYSAATYPGGQSNTTGWAEWAGTSFATPVIAGVAACLWAQSARYQPTELIERIRGFARPMRSDLPPDVDPDGPLDAPLLPASQEHVSPGAQR